MRERLSGSAVNPDLVRWFCSICGANLSVALVYLLTLQTLKVRHIGILTMDSSQTARTRPIGIKLICGVEGVGGAIVGLFFLVFAFRSVLEGQPPVFMLVLGLLSLLAMVLIALYGLWTFTSWGWWATIIFHVLFGLIDVWTILATHDDVVYKLFGFSLEQDVVRFVLTVFIVFYLYVQRDLYL